MLIIVARWTKANVYVLKSTTNDLYWKLIPLCIDSVLVLRINTLWAFVLSKTDPLMTLIQLFNLHNPTGIETRRWRGYAIDERILSLIFWNRNVLLYIHYTIRVIYRFIVLLSALLGRFQLFVFFLLFSTLLCTTCYLIRQPARGQYTRLDV